MKKPYHIVTRAARESAAVIEQFCQANGQHSLGSTPPTASEYRAEARLGTLRPFERQQALAVFGLTFVVAGEQRTRLVSDANGKFVFTKLTAGTYLLCARAAPSRQLVDFCEWRLNPPSVKLISGQSVGGVQLLLFRGARLELQVDDPKSLLPDPEESRPGTEFHMGVRTGEGLFHEAKLTSRAEKYPKKAVRNQIKIPGSDSVGVLLPAVSNNDLVPLTFNLGGVAGTQTLYIAVRQ